MEKKMKLKFVTKSNFGTLYKKKGIDKSEWSKI